MSIRSELANELSQIIASHFADVELYVPGGRVYQQPVSEDLLASIERLTEITRTSPHAASRQMYQEASACLGEIADFLRIMNHAAAHSYKSTTLDNILIEANNWCSLVPATLKSSDSDVWDLIAPAIPDHIEVLGNGQYEARWWKPVPVMDVEILKYTDGIHILADPFEPETLSGGLALRFAVAGHTTNVPAE